MLLGGSSDSVSDELGVGLWFSEDGACLPLILSLIIRNQTRMYDIVTWWQGRDLPNSLTIVIVITVAYCIKNDDAKQMAMIMMMLNIWL